MEQAQDTAETVNLSETPLGNDTSNITPSGPPTSSTRVQAHIDPDTVVPQDDSEHWEIEKIVGAREVKSGRRNVQQYQVRWKGFGAEHDTWRDLNDLDADELIQEYWTTQRPTRAQAHTKKK